MGAGIAIVHHSITGTWAMGWDDLLFWKRNQTYGDGVVSRSWDFTVRPGSTISVECADGDVQVSRGEDDRVGVEIWLAGATADIDNYKTLARQTDPATIMVTSKGAEGWEANGSGRARVLLFVPERSNVTIDVTRGGAAVDGLKGAVAVRAAGGDIAVLGGEGPLALGTAEGKVVVQRHRGGGSITAARGSVETSYVEGSLMVTARGGIDLRSHVGPVRAISVEGSVSAELLRPDSACTLSSRDGDISLKLLPNAGVDLDALSATGSIMNMLGADTSAPGHPTYGQLTQPINGGGIPVTLRTEHGNIELTGYGE
jgi:hypothetical protein